MISRMRAGRNVLRGSSVPRYAGRDQPRGSSRGVPAGSDTRKVLPFPSPGLSARISPPWSSTSFFVSDNPSPVPSFALPGALSSCSKGLKSRPRFSRLIPMPVSAMTISNKRGPAPLSAVEALRTLFFTEQVEVQGRVQERPYDVLQSAVAPDHVDVTQDQRRHHGDRDGAKEPYGGSPPGDCQEKDGGRGCRHPADHHQHGSDIELDQEKVDRVGVEQRGDHHQHRLGKPEAVGHVHGIPHVDRSNPCYAAHGE